MRLLAPVGLFLVLIGVIFIVIVMTDPSRRAERRDRKDFGKRSRLAEEAIDAIDTKARQYDSLDHILAMEIDDIIKKYREELRN